MTVTQPAAAKVEPGEAEGPAVANDEEELVESELLVEEISIDGMCGVY